VRKRPRVCVITGFGINADEELAYGFGLVGADALLIHVRELIAAPRLLSTFGILAFPGGFSFGDHLGSGKVFATLFRRSLGNAMTDFVEGGGLVVGICNGFQVLVKMGVLPNMNGSGTQEVSLIHNDSGKYEDRWVRVRFEPNSRCVWTEGLPDMDLPVRHGEGKFVVRSTEDLETLASRGLIAMRYVSRDSGMIPVTYPDDPNGSDAHVAGICDPTGRVFGLMPHPEAFLHRENHPEWTRGEERTAGAGARGEGLRILANGVRAAAARS
jgi:phosphoribosylformylglycinamidine (FGAM) synthase-like amidotransferase family enzyme